MSLSLYSAASGMDAQQTRLNVISNNIANVSTTGFKKSNVEFQDLFYQVTNLAAETENSVVPTGKQIGAGTQVVSTSKVFTQGQMTRTDERLDLAIVGDGFLRVEGPNGETLYTRDGGLKISPDGALVTSAGMSVIGAPAVPQGTTNIAIGETGIVTFMDENEVLATGQINIATFNNPSGLRAEGGNLFQETPASGTPRVGAPGSQGRGSLQQGYLETSNVNIVEEMVNMILAQRAYEINSRSIQTSDEMMQQTGQLKR